MSQLFLKIINMSISASYIVIAVLLLRLLLRKAPKWVTVVLWGIVAVRLVCPFSIESVLSLMPSAETLPTEVLTGPDFRVQTGIAPMDDRINDYLGDHYFEGVTVPVNNGFNVMTVLTLIWIVGVLALVTYTAISYWRLHRKIHTAVLLCDNIYQSENVVSPFVLGIIKPRIYLPFHMEGKETEYVVAHETAHIRRKDHLWKPFGFLLLTLHWFNPLMWLGYIMLCRDIELACDEKVIGELDRDARADYSQALLTCSVNRRMIAACPLAFGEVGVKDRVRSVLNYKKPAFWLIVAAVIACAAVAVCFLTNPLEKSSRGIKNIEVQQVDPDAVNLKIRYSYPSGGYCVRCVSEEEGEYCGDGIKEYDGALGKYRILVEFGDADPSAAFMETYPVGQVIELEGGAFPMRVKRVHPQDHGFAFYVGFDRPVWVEPIDNGELKPLGGSFKIPIRVLSNDLIYGFVPPAADSDKLFYVNIQDFGCDVKNVSVEFKGVRFENGHIYFDIQWKNNGVDHVDIGPDFKVYRYNGLSAELLEHKGIWLLYQQLLPGKGMNFADPAVGAKLECETTVSYNLSSHYDITSPGKYCFDAHGVWVKFEMIGDVLLDEPKQDQEQAVLSTVIFPDIDKHITLEPRYSETVFVEDGTEGGGFYYHRYFIECSQCGQILESEDIYRCQINHSQCKGSCIP